GLLAAESLCFEVVRTEGELVGVGTADFLALVTRAGATLWTVVATGAAGGGVGVGTGSMRDEMEGVADALLTGGDGGGTVNGPGDPVPSDCSSDRLFEEEPARWGP